MVDMIPEMTMTASPSSESGNNTHSGADDSLTGRALPPPPDDIITTEIENLQRQLELLEQKRLKSSKDDMHNRTTNSSGHGKASSKIKEYESSGEEGDFTYEVDGIAPSSRGDRRSLNRSSHSFRSRASRGRSIGRRRTSDSEFETEDEDFDDFSSSVDGNDGRRMTGSVGAMFGDSDDEIDISRNSKTRKFLDSSTERRRRSKLSNGDKHINSYITLKTVHSKDELRVITKQEEELFKDEHPTDDPLQYPPIYGSPKANGGASKTSASGGADKGNKKRILASRRMSTTVATLGGTSDSSDEDDNDNRYHYRHNHDDPDDDFPRTVDPESKNIADAMGDSDEEDGPEQDNVYMTEIGEKASPLDNIESALPETNPLLRAVMVRQDSTLSKNSMSSSTHKKSGSNSVYTAISYEIKSRKGSSGGSGSRRISEASYKRKGGKMVRPGGRTMNSEDESSISSSDLPPPPTHVSVSISSSNPHYPRQRHSHRHSSAPPDNIKNMFIDTSGMEKVTAAKTRNERSSLSTSHRSLTRFNNKSQYSSIMPVKIVVAENGRNRSARSLLAEATSVQSADWELDGDRHYQTRRPTSADVSDIDEEDTHEIDTTTDDDATDDTGLSTPPFRQFTVIQIKSGILSQFSNEHIFVDEGARYLDPYCLSLSSRHQLQKQKTTAAAVAAQHIQQHQKGRTESANSGNLPKEDDDFGISFEQYPRSVRPDFLDNQSLSVFCLPSGLRVRFIPRSAHDGAQRIGWIGKVADKSHVLVFTDESGLAHHGVCITVREEYVPSSKSEKSKLVHAMKSRQRRRYAAAIIARWWKQFLQYRILTNALHIAGFENFTAWDLKAELTPSEMQLLERSLKHCPLAGKDVFGSTNTSSIMRSSSNTKNKNTADLQKRMNKQGIRRKVRRVLARDKANNNTSSNNDRKLSFSGNNRSTVSTRDGIRDSNGSPERRAEKAAERMSPEEVNAVESVTRAAIMRHESQSDILSKSNIVLNNKKKTDKQETKVLNSSASKRLIGKGSKSLKESSSSSRGSNRRLDKYKLLDDNSNDNQVSEQELHRRKLSRLRDIAKTFQEGVSVKDRQYHLRTYRDCFVGSEAVDYLVNSNHAESREAAVDLGNELMFELGLFDHVVNDHSFRDEYLFFRFKDDNITNTSDHSFLDAQVDKDDARKKGGGLLRVLERADNKSKKGKKSKLSSSRSVSSMSRQSKRSLGLRSMPAVSGGNDPANAAGGGADDDVDDDDGNRSTLSDFLKRKNKYVKQSTRYGSVKTELTPISDKTPPMDNTEPVKHSKTARKLGVEAYQTMKAADKLGYMCIVEKCYVLVGCRPDNYSLLLGPLQQLVNSERDDWLRRLRQIRNQMRRGHGDSTVRAEQRLIVDLENNRHLMIDSMLDRLRLSNKQQCMPLPSSQLDYIQGRQRFFKTRLPFSSATPIKLPLPLPNIGRQWGVAKLLLTIGPDSLILALKLLLLERSMIVLGENLEDVTSCACALLELLRPFEWASAFMPVLPVSMLDFVHSPVPFIAGVAANHGQQMIDVENDERVVQAMSDGLSIINLTSSTLLITTETGVSQMLSLDPYLREQLTFLHERLQHYTTDPTSSVCSFDSFVTNGMKPKEVLTLDSITSVLQRHFQSYCGDLATSANAWKRYGTIDVKSGNFVFYPAWFMNPIRADQFFHEAIVHTQLFMGYVDDRRTEQMDLTEIKKGDIGKYIAYWIYRKWKAKKQRYFNKFVLDGSEKAPAASDKLSSNLTTSVLTG